MLWIGQTVSMLGNGAYTTALAWEVLLLTHSGAAMGAVLIASTAPTLLFLLAGGVAADRLPRRYVMLGSDAGRAAVLFVIAALGALHILQLWHLIVLSVLFGVVRGFFSPAYEAIIPELVEKDALPSANGLTGISANTGQLLGPLLGATLVAATGPYLAFAFDGLTFVVSALFLLALHPAKADKVRDQMPQDQWHAEGESEGLPLDTYPVEIKAPRRGLAGILADIREGWVYIAGSAWLTVTILIPALGNIGWTGAYSVALPKLVADVYHQGVGLLGGISAANALGSIVGLLLIAQFKLRHRGIVCFSLNIVASIALATFGLPWPETLLPALACGASAVVGLCLEAFNAVWLGSVQTLVPTDKLGRVFSLDALGSLAMLPIGYALAGLVTDHWSAAWVFVAGGALNLGLSLIALTLRGVRDFD
jgi:MFS family permease